MTSPSSLLVSDTKGWHDGGRQIKVSFIDEVPGYYPTVSTTEGGPIDAYQIDESNIIPFGAAVAMTQAERDFALTALAEWNGVAKVNAVLTQDGPAADITLGAYAFGDPGLFGFVADFPGTLGTPSKNGDLWINRSNPMQATGEYGATSWQTFLHELGHAFGLRHPDEDPNNTAQSPNNDNQYTSMSYVPHPSFRNLQGADQSWPITPMQYDIAALQMLYGANLTTRADDTRYFAPGSAYALQDGGLLENGRTAILTIWDAGGIDTLDASGQTGAVRLDLNPGAFSTIGPYADTIAMSLAHEENGVVVNLIENATGGSGNDALAGNLADNHLVGGLGDDTLEGGLGGDMLEGGDGEDAVGGGVGDDRLHGGTGDDTLEGGDGRDQVFGEDGDDRVLCGDGDDFGSGGFGSDTVRGEAGNDLLFGDDNGDWIDGGTGNDDVYGGTGDDTLFGSEGLDRIMGEDGGDFIGAGAGNDTASGGAGNDEVHGEGGNDVLTGDVGNDGVYGGGGDDLVSGGAGDDVLTGDAGNDALRGEDGDDRLSGGSDTDDLSGGAGADVMDGGAGADLLFGNAGDDVLTGGAGADIFAFGRGDGLDRILDFLTGGPEADVIAFNGGVFADFAAVQAASRQEGADVLIAYGAGEGLTLQSVQLGSLTAASFVLV